MTGSGATPTGTVVFSNGSTKLCSATLNQNGSATCGFTPAVSGSVIITASYKGDGNYLASTTSLPLNVYDPSVTMQFSSMQLTYPGAANVTACILGTSKTAATGNVKIYDGAALLNTETLQGNGCAYWYISPGLAAGNHTLTASYAGDASHAAGTSAATTIDVTPVAVNMAVSCWNASFAYGANYQCTVNASSNAGSAQGSITYAVDGGTKSSLPLNSGNAQFTLTKPAVGTHQVVVGYAQQTNYAAAGPETESFTVTAAPVNLALTPSTYYTTTGTKIAFTTAVTSWSAGAPNATGSVAFYDGSTLLGTVAVNSSGTAVFSTSTLAAGAHTITATYAEGMNYATGSSSATITLTP